MSLLNERTRDYHSLFKKKQNNNNNNKKLSAKYGNIGMVDIAYYYNIYYCNRF